jgi:hypothetical protein
MFVNISMLSGDVLKECASWDNLAGGRGGGTRYAELPATFYKIQYNIK